MTNYRREYNKIYTKINKLAQKGPEYIFEYYELIDEIIAKKQYIILQDVMLTKYEIQMRNFRSISEFKEFSFKEIRKAINDASVESIQRVLNQKLVYLVGFHVYESSNNHYLGDIREENIATRTEYTNPRLQNITVQLQVEKGLPSSVNSAIPHFDNNPSVIRTYSLNDLLLYQGNIYQCQLAYTYSYTNRITPTFSAYWAQMIIPTYSVAYFTESNTTVVQKYAAAIDFLRGFTYSNLSANSFVAEDYVDDYVE